MNKKDLIVTELAPLRALPRAPRITGALACRQRNITGGAPALCVRAGEHARSCTRSQRASCTLRALHARLKYMRKDINICSSNDPVFMFIYSRLQGWLPRNEQRDPMSASITEEDMEHRLMRLESDMARVRSDVRDLKYAFEGHRRDMRRSHEDLRAEISVLKDSVAFAKIWAFLIAMALLGVMAWCLDRT